MLFRRDASVEELDDASRAEVQEDCSGSYFVNVGSPSYRMLCSNRTRHPNSSLGLASRPEPEARDLHIVKGLQAASSLESDDRCLQKFTHGDGPDGVASRGREDVRNVGTADD